MSTRPVPPSIWAPGANYPAGSDDWSTTPLKTAPAGDYFTPYLGAAAQEINFLLNAQTTKLGEVLDWAGTAPALNWSAPFLVPSNDSVTAMSWDARNGRWVVAVRDDAGDSVSIVTGSGAPEDWVNLQEATGAFFGRYFGAVLADPRDGNRFVRVSVAPSSGDPSVRTVSLSYLNLSVSNLWQGSTSFANTRRTVSDLGFFNNLFHYFSGADGGQFINDGGIWSSPDGDVWTQRLTPVFAINRWSVAQSAARMVAVPSPVVDANAETYWTTNDGTTWTQRAAALGLASTDKMRAIAYGWTAIGNAFLLAIQSGTTVKFASSTDGLAWTMLPNTLTSRTITDMKAMGSLFLATFETAGVSETLFSVDGGGTWRRAPARFASNVATSEPFFTRPRLAIGETSIAQWNTKGIRLSAHAGLPLPVT